jgi:hypothetical protein
MIDDAGNSSATSALNNSHSKMPAEVIEQREKKKYLRAESRFYKDEENPNPFMRK